METLDTTLHFDKKLSKYHQFTNLLLNMINSGELKRGEKLPSIIEASFGFGISRDTVLRSYKDLYKKGFLTSVYRKGYYVSTPSSGTPCKKVVMITSGLNSANFLFYQKLSKIMEDNQIQSDIKIYHNNLERLAYLMDEVAGNYHTFIIDPQLLSMNKVLNLLKSKVVKDEIILLNDENIEGLPCKRHILFDFENDFYKALIQLSDRLDQYQNLNLVLPATEYFPYKLINGFFNYCDKVNKNVYILEEITKVEKQNAYIIIDEKSLFGILTGMCQNQLEAGKDIGLLALFERPYLQYLNKKITSLNWFNAGLMSCIVSAIKNDQQECLKSEVELNLRESL